MSFDTKPLDVTTWSDFARLAEDHHGVWEGCWCLGFHDEGRPHVHTPEQRRALKEGRVRDGRAHAALVFDGGQCVGWCQFGPTEELPAIKHQKAYRDGLRELPDWRITCFFVGRTHRHHGVADAALAGALAQIAGLGGGTVLETLKLIEVPECSTVPLQVLPFSGLAATAACALPAMVRLAITTSAPPPGRVRHR